MPVVDYIKDNFTEMVTWNVTESEEELRDYVNLTPKREAKMQLMPHKQRMEYLGLRACLLELNSDLDVHYDLKGKPWLDSGNKLSISHSYGMVTVGLSSFNIGIDIEKRRNFKILNIAKKFVREDEFEWIPAGVQFAEYLHIVWGIKEGLYKINGGNLWNFRHHYRVESFDIEKDNTIICWITDEVSSRKYFAHYKMIDDYFLIWVLDYE